MKKPDPLPLYPTNFTKKTHQNWVSSWISEFSFLFTCVVCGCGIKFHLFLVFFVFPCFHQLILLRFFIKNNWQFLVTIYSFQQKTVICNFFESFREFKNGNLPITEMEYFLVEVGRFNINNLLKVNYILFILTETTFVRCFKDTMLSAYCVESVRSSFISSNVSVVIIVLGIKRKVQSAVVFTHRCYYTTLHSNFPNYHDLHFTALHIISSHSTLCYCTAPCYLALHCTALHFTALYWMSVFQIDNAHIIQ